MKIIEQQDAPIAGEQYSYSIEQVAGKAVIEVYIDNQIILKHECDDPPCHEMVFIPTGTRGSDLSIIATDSAGSIEKLELKIIDSDSGVGGVISM